jgi:hypothetical protein
MRSDLAIFEKLKIRRVYDENEETWFFSVIDVVAALSDSDNPRDYWFKMKVRVKGEDGIELSTICRQLKLEVQDVRPFSFYFLPFIRPRPNRPKNPRRNTRS